MRGLLLAAMAEAGLITWRDLSNNKSILPLPSDYIAVAGYFGALALLPSSAAGVANLLGWGMVVATFMNLFDPTHPTKLVFPGGQSTSAPLPGAEGLNPAGTPLGGQFQTAPPYTGTNFS